MEKIKIEIPSGANEIINTLQKNGYEAFLVGGCVRDSILKRPIHDYDITTVATPDKVMEIFKGKKILETGIKHGTVTIIIDGESYEVTTYRIDGHYSDNRRPDNVTFSKSLEEDLKRRDFTINAMAYNDKDGLIDPFNGRKDLQNGIIRCVGNPNERFSEDALRIMRALRFSAQLGFSIEFNTINAIFDTKKLLKNVSIERINGEFCKIMTAKTSGWVLSSYSSIFAEFIPEIKDMFKFVQNNPYHVYDVWNHTLMVVLDCDMHSKKDLILRLAALFHDIGKPHCYQDDPDGTRHFRGHGKVSADITNEIMKRLRFDNDTREKVVELVYYHDATFEFGEKYIKRWLNKLGEEQLTRLLILRKADVLAQNPKYKDERIKELGTIEHLLEKVLKEKSCFSMKDLVINGNDVMDALCIKSGKDVGAWLNNVLNCVINGELKNDKEEIINWIIAKNKENKMQK